MKVCRTCGISKDENEFSLVYDNVGGRNGQCRSCKSVYDKNRKAIRAKQKRDRKANDPVYALKCRHMTALGDVIKRKGRYKNNSLPHAILGCESSVFIAHIEGLFVK